VNHPPIPDPEVFGREARLGDRTLFPELEARAYLNHSGIAAPSVPVKLAVEALMSDYARQGYAAYLPWRDQRERLRSKIAFLVSAGSSDDIAFVQSTTRGVSDIALCIPWKPKDRIVLFLGEFPSNVTPWQRAASVFDLEVTFLSLTGFAGDAALGLAELEAELARGGGVRLVAVSAVQFQTGLRMPLEAMTALCHRYGAEIFVDGIQACGAVPIDVTSTRVDYLACGSHKWLMGIEGAGFLYIRPDRLPSLRPAVAGWMSHEGGLDFLFNGPGHLRYDRPIRQKADFLEAGNLSAASSAALGASLGLIQQLGVPAIFSHVNGYLDALEAGLLERGFESLRSKHPERRSCILGVHPPPGVPLVALHQGLVARGVACSIPDGVLRFAPHWPNPTTEIPTVLLAVDAAVSSIAPLRHA
jgi:selenocysteine lyase/cysteine desulfurase